MKSPTCDGSGSTSLPLTTWRVPSEKKNQTDNRPRKSSRPYRRGKSLLSSFGGALEISRNKRAAAYTEIRFQCQRLWGCSLPRHVPHGVQTSANSLREGMIYPSLSTRRLSFFSRITRVISHEGSLVSVKSRGIMHDPNTAGYNYMSCQLIKLTSTNLAFYYLHSPYNHRRTSQAGPGGEVTHTENTQTQEIASHGLPTAAIYTTSPKPRLVCLRVDIPRNVSVLTGRSEEHPGW